MLFDAMFLEAQRKRMDIKVSLSASINFLHLGNTTSFDKMFEQHLSRMSLFDVGSFGWNNGPMM